jgi:outer membrane immunogenic protein
MKVMRQVSMVAAGTAAMAVATFASVGIAQADGMPSKGRVVYEKPYDWSGFYFGAHSGWQWSDIQSDFVPGPASDSVSHDSQVVGGQIGLQHQFGNFVLGVEGNLTVAFRDGFANTDCPNPARTCGKRFDDVLTIGPRLGWAMGKWMPYLTGGYANARYSHESFTTATVTNFLIGSERFSGWYIGGGFDMALAHGWTIGLEYRHYEFGETTFLTNSPAGVLSADVRSVDPSMDTVSLRVSWKLGRPAPAPLK